MITKQKVAPIELSADGLNFLKVNGEMAMCSLVLFSGFTKKTDLLENGCSCTRNVAVNKWVCRNNLILAIIYVFLTDFEHF